MEQEWAAEIPLASASDHGVTPLLPCSHHCHPLIGQFELASLESQDTQVISGRIILSRSQKPTFRIHFKRLPVITRFFRITR